MMKIAILIIYLFYFFNNSVSLSDDNFEEIIGIVGNEPVTTYDLSQRIKILLKSLNLEDNVVNRDNIRKRVIELLIEEKIKLIEARKDEIEVSEDEVIDFMSFIFGFEKKDKENFKNFLKDENLDYDILFEQIKVELMWKKSSNQRFSGLINPDPAKIKEIINNYEKRLGKPQYNFSEILILKSDNSWDKTFKSIERVERILKASQNFESVASKFSNAPSSVNSGKMGWVFEKQIDIETLNVLKTLKKNEISNIFRVKNGFKIIKLLEKRKLGEKNNKTYSLISFSSKNLNEKLKKLKKDKIYCKQNFDYLKNENIEVNKIEDVKFIDLPLDTQKKIEDKIIGEVTDVLNIKTKSFVFLICDIKGGELEKIDERLVEQKLFQERLNIMENTYLNKLKKQSNINFNAE